jgi:D-alanyl-D-alanine carboxypeptidase
LAAADNDPARGAKIRPSPLRTLGVVDERRPKGTKAMTSSRLPLGRSSLAALVFTLAGVAGCHRDSESPAPHDAPVEAALQQILDQAVAKPDVFLPGAITYYHAAGWAPWAGSAGLGELEAQVPMRADSRIRAGSILKTFVAVVTLQLVEEGVLSLDRTLPELLPASVTDAVPNASRITLRMLLNHTSGIPEWTTPEVDAFIASHPEHVWTEGEILAIALDQPPRFEPGAGWSYSNANYTLVGMVLERAAGTSWRTQVRARVIAPLGLASTSLPEPGDRTITEDHAHG